MGGLAVAIDWRRPTSTALLESMLSLIAHRGAGGMVSGRTDHAVLGEARDGSDPATPQRVTTVGPLSIVGDLRLWKRAGLRARAGGGAVPRGIGDRRLLLAAYARTGLGFLDDVEGDFAFVIWDEDKREVLAVRDRFAVKPLYYDQTDSGIRFASEPKQLVCTSERVVEPCSMSIAELLVGRFREDRLTYFEGVRRVRPARRVLANPSGVSEIQYWAPSPDTVTPPATSDVAGEFREHLVESVRLRVQSSNGVVSHLSGGLDSTAVAAAAGISAQRGVEFPPFHTVSTVFPGFECDESTWIDEIVELQSFPHHRHVPEIPDVAVYDSDMWEVDSPWVQQIRGMWTYSADIGRRVGADLILSGKGGDEVAGQSLLLSELLRAGSLRRWLQASTNYAAWSRRRIDRVLLASVRGAMPARLKSSVRSAMPAPERPGHSLIHPDLWREMRDHPASDQRIDYGFASTMQDLTVAGTLSPPGVWSNDAMEINYAYRGLGLSHPFLDRSVVEFVASIPVVDRPIDGRSKALLRRGFAGALPERVLNRPVATVFDDYLDAVFLYQGLAYRERFPAVTDTAAPYVDANRYNSALERFDSGRVDRELGDALFNTWTLMAWMEGLGRYRPGSA